VLKYPKKKKNDYNRTIGRMPMPIWFFMWNTYTDERQKQSTFNDVWRKTKSISTVKTNGFGWLGLESMGRNYPTVDKYKTLNKQHWPTEMIWMSIKKKIMFSPRTSAIILSGHLKANCKMLSFFVE
jgi:hypothetical protein